MNKKQTSNTVAAKSAKLLANPKTPKSIRTIAASNLSQAAGKRAK